MLRGRGSGQLPQTVTTQVDNRGDHVEDARVKPAVQEQLADVRRDSAKQLVDLNTVGTAQTDPQPQMDTEKTAEAETEAVPANALNAVGVVCDSGNGAESTWCSHQDFSGPDDGAPLRANLGARLEEAELDFCRADTLCGWARDGHLNAHIWKRKSGTQEEAEVREDVGNTSKCKRSTRRRATKGDGSEVSIETM